MEKIKKVSLVLILMIIIGMCGLNKTYAVVKCNIGIEVASQEVTQDEEFTVTIRINNVQGERGVIALGGVIEYNKSLLTLTKRSSSGAWSLSYNETTGQFVSDRDGFAKSNENVLTLTFTAKEAGNATITVKNVVATDAEDEENVSSSSKSINIKAKSNKDENSGNQGENQGNNNNQGGSSGNQSGSQTSTNKTSNKTTNKGTSSQSGSKKTNNKEQETTQNETENPEENQIDTNSIVNEIDQNIIEEDGNTIQDNIQDLPIEDPEDKGLKLPEKMPLEAKLVAVGVLVLIPVSLIIVAARKIKKNKH